MHATELLAVNKLGEKISRRRPVNSRLLHNRRLAQNDKIWQPLETAAFSLFERMTRRKFMRPACAYRARGQGHYGKYPSFARIFGFLSPLTITPIVRQCSSSAGGAL